ncbi:Hypothetical protein R9X50_00158800 [Acrodontium crateriforme]|uniref:Uncharacterized protein n=1 Tax=Acrodontium crateriforme TaxID=150365 RepID=A0AAQ3M2A9_9PEZI|nr:Hypothetical protein R9X50_00158800 [Acrodontium crateriforme]
MQPLQLSKADSKVLAQVFDPESGPAKAEVIVNPDLPADRHIADADVLLQLKGQEKQAISLIEAFEKSTDRTTSKKQDVYRQSLAILDGLIAKYPQYASARNNRAQLRRWRFGDRNTLCQKSKSTQSEMSAAASASVDDLRQSIALSSPERPQDAVSPSQGRLLGQAHTQLAAIYYAASKDLESGEDFEITCNEFESWNKDRFEEEASRMFYLGGLYGNEVAKALAVHTNPHAKLCGSIVKEAMKKEIELAL